jgi:hypothetical protein
MWIVDTDTGSGSPVANANCQLIEASTPNKISTGTRTGNKNKVSRLFTSISFSSPPALSGGEHYLERKTTKTKQKTRNNFIRVLNYKTINPRSRGEVGEREKN